MTIQDEIKNKIVPNEIVDEVKDVTLYKKVEGLKDDLATAKKCIREKDRRITKIEDRWNFLAGCFNWSLGVAILILVGVAFTWIVVHIHHALPTVLYNTYDDLGNFLVLQCNDAFLLWGLWTIVVLAGIGLVAIIICVYMLIYED